MTNLLTFLEVADLLKEHKLHSERSRQRKDKFSILSQDSQNFKFLCYTEWYGRLWYAAPNTTLICSFWDKVNKENAFCSSWELLKFEFTKY